MDQLENPKFPAIKMNKDNSSTNNQQKMAKLVLQYEVLVSHNEGKS